MGFEKAMEKKLDETHKVMWDLALCLAAIQTGGKVENEWINRVLEPANKLEKQRQARERILGNDT